MSDFLPDDYCVHCHQEWQVHVEGKCLFDSTSFVLDVVRSVVVRNSRKDMTQTMDAEIVKLLSQVTFNKKK